MPSKKHRLTFIIPDAHAPFHNKKSWALILEQVKKLNPSEIVIIGDLADFYAVSRFSKDPQRKTDLSLEVDAINVMLYHLEDMANMAEVTFLEGNHEDRLRRYLCDKAPELYGFFDIKKLFKLKERGWKHIPYGDYYRKGKVTYVHDLGHFGKYAMQRTLDSAQTNVVFGHSHRAGIVYSNHNAGGGNFCMNVGCIIDINDVGYGYKFKAEREWTQGFGLVEEFDKLAYAQFVPIIKGQVLLK